MKFEKSCGCIVIKDSKILLIKQKSGDWGFPKGHVEKDETEQQTALRETKEETNINASIKNDKRYVIEYNINDDTLKTVVFFLATCKDTDVKAQETEIDDIEWLPYNEALEKITYEDTKELLKKVKKDI